MTEFEQFSLAAVIYFVLQSEREYGEQFMNRAKWAAVTPCR